MDEQMIETAKVVMADTFKFYIRTHGYHWNIEGPDFYQYHKLLEGIYEEVYGSIDTIAEQIRAMGSHVPGSLGRLAELSELSDEREHVDALTMLYRLYQDNEKVLAHIKIAYDAAEAAGNHGWSNFLAERQSAHKKHSWFLRATLKA
jgi:starvation-inducible DNA-binding protein